MFILDKMLFFLILLLGLSAGQRLPPGINPKRYQLPEHTHSAQSQEYSYKYLQEPHHHHHHEPSQPDLAQKVLTTGNIQLERSHIQEHMPVPIDTSHMSDAELQFHYFKMHDSDDNNKLDGCELYKALIHFHDEGNNNQVNVKTLSDGELAALIDPILEMDDTSRDGFIDYPEFIKARDKKPV
ncbi:hypothetical protein KR032_009978 [Drosophila birchii]|nr:hypothetical protein KR032_009978 [Drosophila birchii]